MPRKLWQRTTLSNVSRLGEPKTCVRAINGRDLIRLSPQLIDARLPQLEKAIAARYGFSRFAGC